MAAITVRILLLLPCHRSQTIAPGTCDATHKSRKALVVVTNAFVYEPDYYNESYDTLVAFKNKYTDV